MAAGRANDRRAERRIGAREYEIWKNTMHECESGGSDESTRGPNNEYVINREVSLLLSECHSEFLSYFPIENKCHDQSINHFVRIAFLRRSPLPTPASFNVIIWPERSGAWWTANGAAIVDTRASLALDLMTDHKLQFIRKCWWRSASQRSIYFSFIERN